MRRAWMLGIALCVCASRSSGQTAPSRAAPAAKAVAASNAFGFKLYGQLERRAANAICSPISASVALTMAWAGAGGEAKQEMTKVLGLGIDAPGAMHDAYAALLRALNRLHRTEEAELRVADRVWVQQGLEIRPDYLALLRDRYRAPLQAVDFTHRTEAARVAINRWAAAQTKGRIPQILLRGDLTSDSRLVLTNAVYYKAPWMVRFEKGATAERPFSTPGGRFAVATMHKEGTFRHARVKGAQLLELDYRGGASMVIVLPQAANGLEAIEARLADEYGAWLKALDYKLLDIEVPRWTTRSRFSLGEVLAAMGMPTAFGPTADFSAITGQERIHLDNVLQEAFVNVDEEGTEAAAVTAVTMKAISDGGPRGQPIPFHADRPFLYLIRDRNTGVVLFIGRVVDPR